MAAAERLYKTMILPIFDNWGVAWHGRGKVNPDALERLQHRAASLFFPNSGLDTKELNYTLDIVPLIKRLNLHIVLLTKNTVMVQYRLISTRSCNNIRIPKVNLEVSNWSFYFTGAMEFSGPPRHIKSNESFIELSRDTKNFFLNDIY